MTKDDRRSYAPAAARLPCRPEATNSRLIRFENAYLQFVFPKTCSILPPYWAFVVIKLKDMS